ncbi:MAG: hypothetical protein P8176_01405 [Gammaproteobacteria bacterium]
MTISVTPGATPPPVAPTPPAPTPAGGDGVVMPEFNDSDKSKVAAGPADPPAKPASGGPQGADVPK